jgi:mRNA interferase MazF
MAAVTIRRGDVWWYEPPEDGPRPVLVMTREQAIDRLEKLVVIPATRTVRGIETEVGLDRQDGMPSECTLTLDNVTVVRKSLLTERITQLESPRMSEVCRALKTATGC